MLRKIVKVQGFGRICAGYVVKAKQMIPNLVTMELTFKKITHSHPFLKWL